MATRYALSTVPSKRAAAWGSKPVGAVAWVRQRPEQIAHAREEAAGRGRLVLSLPDLGERERGVGDDLPRSQSLAQLDPSLDRFRRRCRIAAPAEQDSVRDVRHHRPRMLVELGPVQLSYHGPGMERVVEPGRFRVMVGGSSDAVKSVALEVTGQ